MGLSPLPATADEGPEPTPKQRVEGAAAAGNNNGLSLEAALLLCATRVGECRRGRRGDAEAAELLEGAERCCHSC